MQYKFFIIHVASSETAQIELNSFLAQYKVLSIREEFVANAQNSFWAVSVSYLGQENARAASSKKTIDYKDVLSEADFIIYSQLRELRKTLSTHQGVPPYILFTNEQLAAFVTKQVNSKTKMKLIEGVGEGRIDKYAEPFLGILNQWFEVAR